MGDRNDACSALGTAFSDFRMVIGNGSALCTVNFQENPELGSRGQWTILASDVPTGTNLPIEAIITATIDEHSFRGDYEVLNDPEKRKKYDALGADWQHGGDFNPGAGSGFYDFGGGGGGSYRFGGTGFSDFFESMFGGTGGMGGFGGFGGGGHPQPQMRSRGRDIEADMMVTLEQVLHGAKRQVSLQEPARPGEPAGKPKKVKQNNYKVFIKALRTK